MLNCETVSPNLEFLFSEDDDVVLLDNGYLFLQQFSSLEWIWATFVVVDVCVNAFHKICCHSTFFLILFCVCNLLVIVLAGSNCNWELWCIRDVLVFDRKFSACYVDPMCLLLNACSYWVLVFFVSVTVYFCVFSFCLNEISWVVLSIGWVNSLDSFTNGFFESW